MNLIDVVTVVFEAGTKHRLFTFLYPSKSNGGKMTMRRVEPYSFRYPSTGSVLLYCWDVDADGLRSFKLGNIVSPTVDDESFEPRFEVELDLSR